MGCNAYIGNNVEPCPNEYDKNLILLTFLVSLPSKVLEWLHCISMLIILLVYSSLSQFFKVLAATCPSFKPPFSLPYTWNKQIYTSIKTKKSLINRLALLTRMKSVIWKLQSWWEFHLKTSVLATNDHNPVQCWLYLIKWVTSN